MPLLMDDACLAPQELWELEDDEVGQEMQEETGREDQDAVDPTANDGNTEQVVEHVEPAARISETEAAQITAAQAAGFAEINTVEDGGRDPENTGHDDPVALHLLTLSW